MGRPSQFVGTHGRSTAAASTSGRAPATPIGRLGGDVAAAASAATGGRADPGRVTQWGYPRGRLGAPPGVAEMSAQQSLDTPSAAAGSSRRLRRVASRRRSRGSVVMAQRQLRRARILRSGYRRVSRRAVSLLGLLGVLASLLVTVLGVTPASATHIRGASLTWVPGTNAGDVVFSITWSARATYGRDNYGVVPTVGSTINTSSQPWAWTSTPWAARPRSWCRR